MNNYLDFYRFNLKLFNYYTDLSDLSWYVVRNIRRIEEDVRRHQSSRQRPPKYLTRNKLIIIELCTVIPWRISSPVFHVPQSSRFIFYQSFAYSLWGNIAFTWRWQITRCPFVFFCFFYYQYLFIYIKCYITTMTRSLLPRAWAGVTALSRAGFSSALPNPVRLWRSIGADVGARS